MQNTAALSWLIPDDMPIDWRSKCWGPAQTGRTVAELVARGTRLHDLPTPLLTLDAAAVEHNSAVMATFLDEHGVVLAPHGKTTMAPQLWRRQCDAGAWGITVATPWQLRVAAHHGIKRIHHANAVLDPAELRSFAALLTDDPDLEIFVWADSPEAAALTARGYQGGTRPLNVLVDRGGPGSRTGARTLAESVATAKVVHDAENVRLAGVTAWEGSLEGAHGVDGREIVAQFCGGVADTFRTLVDSGYLKTADRPVISGGGSAFFDIVVEKWSPLRALGAQIVLRSGCYLTHDDGEYAHSSPFGRGAGESLTAALHVWAQVISRPEPGLALLNAGRRDVPYDLDLPIPQVVRGRDLQSSAAALAGAAVRAVNDQHAYLVLDPSSDLALGEVVRLGISHPCTAFDKWTVVPVIDDANAADPPVIGAVRTYF